MFVTWERHSSSRYVEDSSTTKRSWSANFIRKSRKVQVRLVRWKRKARSHCGSRQRDIFLCTIKGTTKERGRKRKTLLRGLYRASSRLGFDTLELMISSSMSITFSPGSIPARFDNRISLIIFPCFCPGTRPIRSPACSTLTAFLTSHGDVRGPRRFVKVDVNAVSCGGYPRDTLDRLDESNDCVSAKVRDKETRFHIGFRGRERRLRRQTE